MAYLDNVYAVVQIAPTGIPTYVRLSQNENGRILHFAISGDALPAGSTVVLTGTKPDGAVYSVSGTLADNIATFNEDEQLTAVAGEWDAKVEVTKSGNLIATGRIKFVIDADPSGGNIPSDSQLDGYIAEMLSLLDAGKAEAYGSPLVASTVAGMTDQSRVYVYTGSETGYTAGNWYYWNGSAWTSGGVYNAVAVSTDTTLSIAGKAADAKATRDAIDELKDDLTYYTEEDISVNTTAEGWRLTGTGVCTEASSYKLVKYLVTAGDLLHLTLSKDVTGSESEGVYQWQSAASVPSNLPNNNLVGTPVSEAVDVHVTVPTGATYLIVSQFKTNTTNSVKKVTDSKLVKDEVTELKETVDNLEPGLSDDAKEALMTCFAHVKWDNEHGQDYYDDLYNALYGVQPDPEVPNAYTRYDYMRVKRYNEVPSGIYDPNANGGVRIDILNSAGGANAMIETDEYSDLNALCYYFRFDLIDVPFTPTGSKNMCPFGGGISSDASARVGSYWSCDKDKFYVMMHGVEQQYAQSFSKSNNNVEIINKPSSPSEVVINGTSLSHTWVNSTVIRSKISMWNNYNFAQNPGTFYGVPMYLKLGDVEIKNQNNELISKLIPVVRKEDNVIGIYDSVREKFYTARDTKFTTIDNSSCIYAVGSWNDGI